MNFRDPFANTSTVDYGQSQAVARDEGLRSYMLKIYNYMASALVLTGLVAIMFANMAVGTDATTGEMGLTALGQAVYMSPLKWVVMLAPLAMVLAMNFGQNKMSVFGLQACFWGFATLMGLSLSSIFLAYTGSSIARVFFITAGTFGAMSLYGYTTKRDLSGWGSFLMMGLIGVILASLVNLFLKSSALEFAVSVIGVLVFVGLTAYDTQKLKAMYYQLAGHSEAMAKASVMGALNLYMDFINIFLYLLRFFGERR